MINVKDMTDKELAKLNARVLKEMSDRWISHACIQLEKEGRENLDKARRELKNGDV